MKVKQMHLCAIMGDYHAIISLYLIFSHFFIERKCLIVFRKTLSDR